MRTLALALALCAVGAGCSGSDAAAPRVLRAGILRPISLDPLAISASSSESETLVKRQLFEGLVRYDPRTMEPRPALAESWTVSDDARTFTFLLRQDARFHNGRRVVPEDVVFSLSRLAHAPCVSRGSPTASAPGPLLSAVVGYADVASDCKARVLSGVTGAGERTVVVTLSEPWADLPSALGNVAASIVPREVVAANEPGFGRLPIGSGPYRLTQQWDGRTIELARFDGWHGPRPAIDRIELVGYPDDSTAYLDLLRGRLHYAPVPANRVSQARQRFGSRGFVVGTGLYFFGFNLQSRRLAAPGFREALSRAVDRASLATAVFKGTRTPALGVLPPSLPGAGPALCGAVCTFDLADSRRVVSREFPAGPPEVLVAVSTLGPNPLVATALQRMFAAAGVTARVVERPFRDHLRALQAGDADVFQLGLIPEYPAVDGLLWPLLRSGAPDNYMRYASPDVDRLLTEARRTVDPAARTALYADVQRRLVKDMPVLPLLWFRASVALDERLVRADGPVVDGLGMTDFAGLEFSV